MNEKISRWMARLKRFPFSWWFIAGYFLFVQFVLIVLPNEEFAFRAMLIYLFVRACFQDSESLRSRSTMRFLSPANRDISSRK